MWKFASCDGCQLSLLDCEDELLAVADELDIAYFAEASRRMMRGPYDLSLVEGSITTPPMPNASCACAGSRRHLVTIGACATAGGIQALRNFADVREFAAATSIRTPNICRHSRPRRRSAPMLPSISNCAAVRSTRASCSKSSRPFCRAQAGDRRSQRLHRVQDARQCMRHGCARNTMPRSRYPCRVRRDLPVLQPRLLWLLRAGRGANTAAIAREFSIARHGATRYRSRLFQTFNAAAEAFRKEAEAHGD